MKIHAKEKGAPRKHFGPAKVHASTIHWHVFLHPELIVNVKDCLVRSPLRKLPQMIVVFIVVANCFQGIN